MTTNTISKLGKRLLAGFVIAWLSLWSPMAVLADEVATDAMGNPTGAPADTGATACTGAGCGQGEGQGEDQGTDQGGPSAEDLGADEEGNLPEGVEDTRQGAAQGTAQGSGSDITGTNSNTGASSSNEVDAEVDSTTNTDVNNAVNDTSDVDASANTGSNTQSKNTSAEGIKTGNANIGVTQVKNDNTATVGGTSGLNVTGHNGDYDGDLTLDFNAASGQIAGQDGSSVRAINDTTGSDSDNSVAVDTTIEEITEIQNDGRIDNILDLLAVTGQNEANKNTSDGSITTGDANIAATLVNLLNTSVINGSLWLTVADIFGDLNGNIVLPELAMLAAAAGYGDLNIDAVNEETGAGSENEIDIEVNEEETTVIDNEADINTTVNAEAITGQNEAAANTGGGSITTGDGSVSASNISLANTTIEGGNWGLVIVNALNQWLGFLVGESGETRQLTQDETLREIQARNSGTGSDSDNTIEVNDENIRTTNVDNEAVINNEVNAAAITGQNEANKNTGQGAISTGDANVKATAVNIANTTVKDGSLFIAVVNVFGDWFGDLLYDGSSLLAGAGAGGPTVNVDATNSETGAESENEIDVEVNRSQETQVNNEADIDTVLNANIDTGGNRANRNTLGGSIETGDGWLALHSRAVANVTGILLDPVTGLTVNGLNDTTGFDSRNKISVRLNEDRLIEINNDANVSTLIGAVANTGENEASQNTLGGSIETGMIDANVGINNLINQVLLAMAASDGGWASGGLSGGGDIRVEANLTNILTGALSENENMAEALYDLLADINNQGVVDNVIDLLLNTGRNKANENTGGGAVLAGDVCLDGSLQNNVNEYDVAGLVGWSMDIDNDADIDNEFNVDAKTGGNETNDNTGAGVGGDKSGCAEIAMAPEPEEPEGQGGSEGSEQPEEPAAPEGVGGGGDEGDQGPDEDEEDVTEEDHDVGPRVAAAVDDGRGGNGPGDGPREAAINGRLKRFPVAGDIGRSLWLQGQDDPILWYVFAAVSALSLGAAWHLDNSAKYRKWLAELNAAAMA